MKYRPFKSYLGKPLNLPTGKAWYEEDILNAERNFVKQFKRDLDELLPETKEAIAKIAEKYNRQSESPSPQAGSEMYRWVKASERLPEVNQQVFTMVLDSNDQIYESSLRYRGNGRWERQYPKDNFSIPMERVEWLEPIPDSNQDELWLEIGTRIMDGYDNMDKQGDVTKELSSKYIIVKR